MLDVAHAQPAAGDSLARRSCRVATRWLRRLPTAATISIRSSSSVVKQKRATASTLSVAYPRPVLLVRNQ